MTQAAARSRRFPTLSLSLTVAGILSIGVASLCLSLSAQVEAPQTFEVASVKRSSLVGGISAMQIHGNSVVCVCALAIVIERAYAVNHDALVGADWLTFGPDRFEIRAQLPEGASRNDIPAMLRHLLADRFHLAVHWEPKETQAYLLVVAAGGLKMKSISMMPGADGGGGNLPFFGWGRFFGMARRQCRASQLF